MAADQYPERIPDQLGTETRMGLSETPPGPGYAGIAAPCYVVIELFPELESCPGCGEPHEATVEISVGGVNHEHTTPEKAVRNLLASIAAGLSVSIATEEGEL